jgi:sigma-E factor negative regulatory protein RseA
MTDAIHEQLSAFLDGELSAAESELLLKRIERDPQLQAQLERYVLAGEALRAREVQLRPSRDFVARVAAGIESESVSLKSRRLAAQWLKPVAGGAIAAGVAAVALVSLQTPAVLSTAEVQPNTVETSMGTTASVGTSRSTPATDTGLGATYVVPPAGNHPSAPPIRVMNSGQLANYVVAHSEYSSPLGQRNVLSGLVATDERGEQVNVVEVNGQLYIVEQLPMQTKAPASVPAAQRNDSALSSAPR